MATVNEKMTAIADAIRDKTGGTEQLTLDGMAENIPTVYDAGKKARDDEWWDIRDYTTDKNEASSGQYMFSGRFWNKDTFKPTQDVSVSNYTFYYHNWLGDAYDLAQQLEELGVNLIIRPQARAGAFYTAWVSRLPVLDFSNVSFGIWDRTFRHPSGSPLVTIDKIILPPEGTVTSFSDTFANLIRLKNIEFEGVIDKSISFSSCPLTVESMKSIISCLKDYIGTENEFTYSVSFTSACKEALDAEGNTSPNGNTWRDYANDLGWNC